MSKAGEANGLSFQNIIWFDLADLLTCNFGIGTMVFQGDMYAIFRGMI